MMNSIKAGEIHIAPVEDVDGPCFEHELVEGIDVVDFPIGNADYNGDIASEGPARCVASRHFWFWETWPREIAQGKDRSS